MCVSASVSRMLLLGLFCAVSLGAQGISFSVDNFRAAVRLLEKGVIEGSWEGVQAPSAGLKVSYQLAHEFNRVTAAMKGHERLRNRPQGSDDVVNSYELDMQSREEFNIVLMEFRQDVGEQEDLFRDLNQLFARQRSELEERDAAFKEALRIIDDDIAPIVDDGTVAALYITWPYGLPQEVRDVLESVLDQLLAADYPEARAAKWRYLTRIFQRLHNDHRESFREALREMEMQRKLLKYDPAEFFKELGFSVGYCIKKNDEANERSAQMRNGALGD